MLDNISKIGKVLTKTELKLINGATGGCAPHISWVPNDCPTIGFVGDPPCPDIVMKIETICY